MSTTLGNGLDRRRLRWTLAVFFVALAAPTVLLVQQAFSQLKWEAFHQHRALAEELAARIDAQLASLVRAEEARSFADYAFLTVSGDASAGVLQRSPLSAWPVPAAIPGLMGYFQVDADGRLSSPLLPDKGVAAYGIDARELAARTARVAGIERVLAENRLVRALAPLAKVTSPTAASAPLAEPALNATATFAARIPEAETARRPRESKAASETGVAREPLARPAPAPPAASVAMEGDAVSSYSAAPLASPAKREQTAPPASKDAQAAFDELAGVVAEQRRDTRGAIGRVEDLGLEAPYASADAAPSATPEPPRSARKERVVLPQALPAEPAAVSGAAPAVAITTFESELDPFEFSLLASGHMVLFRKVWRDGQRYVQGLLLEQQPFLEQSIAAPFRLTTLARSTDLSVAWRGEVLAAFGGQPERAYLTSSAELAGALLNRARLSAPLADLELVFSVRRLPVGPGAGVVAWTAGVLVLVFVVGFVFMYRAGCRQIDLARQQQDFVAAVSHELKTPLTSIRMYGEMLRAGWVADEAKRRGYYDYIVDESERLSRLIGNVLQLARMTRNDVEATVRAVPLRDLLERIRARVSAQVEHAGFALEVALDPDVADASVLVDEDFASQIVINLVDNALKFCAGAARREVRIECRREHDGIVLAVRDFGAGVPRGQMKRIFRLFYRAEAELTRETVGTGIGLALVRGLASAMGASVDVVNREPGAEFRVRLRVASPA